MYPYFGYSAPKSGWSQHFGCLNETILKTLLAQLVWLRGLSINL